MILVSACLAGQEVRYDGRHNEHEIIKKWLDEGKATLVCPEVLGGLAIPREPAEIVGGTGKDVLEGRGKVMTKSGIDVTAAFLEGAKRTVDIAKSVGATTIVLKEKSPSCGSKMIYDGTHSGNKITGEGVTTALLRAFGYTVLSEEEATQVLE